jgi:hypothetical protein
MIDGTQDFPAALIDCDALSNVSIQLRKSLTCAGKGILGAVCANVGWVDLVNSDSMGLYFTSQRLAESTQSKFGSAIDTSDWNSDEACHGEDVDDLASSSFDHTGKHCTNYCDM